MPKHAPKVLNLTDKTCRMGKIANNLEHHADEWVTAFTIPISGVMLTKDELNDFLRDKYAHASWYTIEKGVDRPAAWWGEEEFAITPSYESEELQLTVSGDRELEFEAEQGDPDDQDDVGRPACKLSRIVLKPCEGGLTELRFALYLLPGIGKVNLMLQEHQHREIKITLADAHPAQKSDKQESLPLGAPAEQPQAA